MMTDKGYKIINNAEQAEAYQVDVDKQRKEFLKTLIPIKQECMTKLEEAIGFCEKNNVPIVVFAKFFDKGFHQWNSFNEDGNNDKYSKDYRKNAWDTIGQFTRSIVAFISYAYTVRVKLYSLTNKDINGPMLDTHPELDN